MKLSVMQNVAELLRIPGRVAEIAYRRGVISIQWNWDSRGVHSKVNLSLEYLRTPGVGLTDPEGSYLPTHLKETLQGLIKPEDCMTHLREALPKFLEDVDGEIRNNSTHRITEEFPNLKAFWSDYVRARQYTYRGVEVELRKIPNPLGLYCVGVEFFFKDKREADAITLDIDQANDYGLVFCINSANKHIDELYRHQDLGSWKKPHKEKGAEKPMEPNQQEDIVTELPEGVQMAQQPPALEINGIRLHDLRKRVGECVTNLTHMLSSPDGKFLEALQYEVQSGGLIRQVLDLHRLLQVGMSEGITLDGCIRSNPNPQEESAK